MWTKEVFIQAPNEIYEHETKQLVLQELNVWLDEFPPDTEGQETSSLPVDEIIDIIYPTMPCPSCGIIEQGFNYADSTFKEMTDLFESRVGNLEIRKNLI